MILLFFCVFLQILCVAERVMNKVLSIFLNGNKVADLRRMLDNLFLSGVFSFVLGLVLLPLQVVGIVLGLLLRNLVVSMWMLALVAMLVSVSESSSSVLSLFVNLYNAGVGGVVDMLVVKPLQLLDFVYRGVVPLYNSFFWMLSQLFSKVGLPFFGAHVDRLPRLVGDFGLLCATTGRAAALLSGRYLECATYAARSRNLGSASNEATLEPHLPFTAPNLQCIGNAHYLTLDLMTPGLYARKTMLHVHHMLSASCSLVSAPLDIVLFPFLDFNLYKTVHCAANAVLHFVVALPLVTITRCDYARDPFNSFSEVEQALMCTPDWRPGFAMVAAGLGALGKLVDNWLNMMLVVVEHSVGRVSVACAQTAAVGEVWDGVQDLFEARGLPLKLVGASQALVVVTDGTSAAFHSLTDGTATTWALGVFPFPVNPLLGVAPVKYGEVFDADAEGDARTGLFGCRCLDRTSAQGVESIEVVCSSVPFRTNTHDNDADYAAHTVQRVVFDAATATDTMTCARTVVRVSALRFSRSRFATGQGGGADSPFGDPFNAFGSAGAGDVRSYAADAMLYVQPVCDGPREACLAGINNCFPWCMGLRVAGQRNHQLRVYNARRWEDSVTLAQTDCVASGVELAADQCAAGTGARAVNLDAGFDYSSAYGVSVGTCSRQDSTTTFMSLDNLRVINSTVAVHREETLLFSRRRLSSDMKVAVPSCWLHVPTLTPHSLW